MRVNLSVVALWIWVSLVAGPSVATAADTLPDPDPFSHFGTGIGFLTKLTGDDLVAEAVVDANGFVRVNKRQNSSAGLLLEVHQLFQPWSQTHNRLGIGPFVGIQSGGNNKVIDAIGGGLMFGFKTSDDKTSHASLNIGVGYAGVISAQSLGSEFVRDAKAPVDSAGKPLPIRFVTHDAGAVMFLASFMF
jgi:hypothetical protein